MSSTHDIGLRHRKKQQATVAAVAALARATAEDAARALRLWQSRSRKPDAELLLMLEPLEHEIKAVPQGTSLAFAAAQTPREPSLEIELYARVLEFFDSVLQSAGASFVLKSD